MKNVSESLAGRVGILELSGLSLREIQGSSFNRPFIPDEKYISERGREFKIQHNIWDWQTFFSSYIQTYIDRDINALGNVKDKLKFTQFLTALAARTGQMLNYSAIASQIDVSVNTVKEWKRMAKEQKRKRRSTYSLNRMI